MQGKWLTSNNYNTGTTTERVAHIKKLVSFHILLVKAFKEAGVPIVAGTDAGVSGVVCGCLSSLNTTPSIVDVSLKLLSSG